jgi:hypothetical protein
MSLYLRFHGSTATFSEDGFLLPLLVYIGRSKWCDEARPKIRMTLISESPVYVAIVDDLASI